MTPGEYLNLERKSEVRNELIAGRMFARSRSNRRHNLITGNFYREFSSQLRGRPCEVHMVDLRVKVSPTGMNTYPDIVALCGEAQLEDEHVDTLLNPTLIVEVL